MKKVKLKYNNIVNIVKTLVTEQEDQYVNMDVKKVKEYLGYVNYKGEQLKRFPEVRGKKIHVTGGKLDLRNSDIDTLGPIAKSDGIIDVSNTKLRSLGDWEGGESRVYIWNTPLYWARVKKEQEEKKQRTIGFIENGDIGPDVNTDFSNKHYAVLNFLMGDDSFEVMDDNEREELITSRKKVEEYEQQLSDLDTGNENYLDRFDELKDIISEIEGRISELEEKISIEDIYLSHHYNGGSRFEVLKTQYRDVDGMVGTESEMDVALLEYSKQYIDEVGISNMNRSFIEDHIDVDSLKETLDFDSDVRNNPEVYLDDSDRELSKEQKIDIYKKQKQIRLNKLELQKTQENSARYKELEEEIEELDEEIEDIKTNPEGDYDEEKIEDIVDSKNADVEKNPMRYMLDYGFDYTNFIDENSLAKALADSEGYSFMATYDGTIEIERINGTNYYMFFTNK